MQFSWDDVRRFARWSGDHNPLHLDEAFARQTHFGRPIVHGVLTVLQALRMAADRRCMIPMAALDIEFRSAVVAGETYAVDATPDGDTVAVTVSQGEQLALSIRGWGPAVPEPDAIDTAWLARAAGRVVRDAPVARTLDELEQGVELTGVYDVRSAADAPSTAALTPLQARVLALCSYLTGMELPGLKSLFTRISVAFHATSIDASEVRYRARTVRFDRQFRLLETELQVMTPGGSVVATARLRSYVPFSPASASLDDLASRLDAGTERLAGQVALIIGGSRGLGSEIAAALALAGARVLVSGRSDDEGRQQRQQMLASRGASIEFLQGDAGDPNWCGTTLQTIRDRHGRLDVVVLNACAPPVALRFGRAAAARHAAYIQENLRLIQAPLSTFGPAVTEAQGSLVYVSSSFAAEPPPGFSHYVAVKQAGEALVRTIVREALALDALIARPPVLQTRWNDTPAGVAGSIPADWAASHIVNALARRDRAGNVTVLSEFPPFEAAVSPEATVAAGPEFTLRIAASFTLDPLVAAVRFWARELDLNARLEIAPYGQVLQSLLDPGSVLNAKGLGFNAVLFRVRDWIRELGEEQAGDVEFVRAFLQETARDFVRAMRSHRAHAASETLLLICPSHGALSSAESILLRQTEAELAASLAGVPGLQVVAAADLHGLYEVDEDQVGDALRDEIGHIPYRDEYMYVLATILARHAHRRLSPLRKVVVVDCDNTVWKGVVGEVGPERLEIDEGHRALHETLTRLAGSGVLVCLCSKNEEADVWRVFETRPDLALRREHVVAAMINWLPKSRNLRTLAARLNLGLDSFVFLDDNPVECAEVRAGCPEVLTVEWPQDPAEATRLLRHMWEFDARHATKEDERRTELYREEFRRQELRAETLTFDDFINGLQLVVDVDPLVPGDVRRAAQLTLRTNQFNFTTIRREESDVQALAAGGRHEIRTVRVRDRFGDYGLVGLVIAERGEDIWTLDTFLLSCRVLGRGVEHRILAEVGALAAAAGATAVRIRVVMTQRNTPARAFLRSVVPAGLLVGDDCALSCDIPADVLAAIRFQPTSADDTDGPIEAESSAAASAPADAERLRRRERQIARTAFELASGEQLRNAIEGRTPVSRPAGPDGDVARVVQRAFASALRTPVERVAALDRLEALGCDSLRIVEITVALHETYPWLPGTLLFEHRSVSAIVREIESLAAASTPANEAPAAGPVRPAEPLPAAAHRADIAVVGMFARCAGADSPRELWDLLSRGETAVRPVPSDREYFLHPLSDSRPHWAGLIEDPASFDAELFGVSPREAEFMDPQLRLFLEVAWSALEDAGCVGADHDSETGVFAGVMYGDYGFRANASISGTANPFRCWEGFSLANRLSQLLGFGGPSLAIDTACSSSGTAVHLACAALRAGECRVAVAGGVNLILDPDRFASLGRLGILSERGVCEPFGAGADGTVLGEGAGVVVLRPLEEALGRGDRIYGVIKGTGLSTGNGTVGFTAPNPQAQSEAIRRSLMAAGIDPRTVSYVETHGTGTALGDPIEVRGLVLGYGHAEQQEPALAVAHRCRIGSVKPNIGHLEAGAGVMALIKVLLQFHHGALLPSFMASDPSPQIPFDQGPFAVQRQLERWERLVGTIAGRAVTFPRRAGVSSFGVGGANAHIIVEEPPPDAAPARVEQERPRHLVALSARSETGLQRQVASVRQYLETHDVPFGDFCFTVNTGRRHFEHRLALQARSREELVAALAEDATYAGPRRGAHGVAAASTERPKIAFLFTGQGSQYVGMGRQLYDTQPVFRAALDRCAAIFDQLLDRPLLELLFAPEGSPEAELLNQTGYTQPALFAFEYALSELWQSWGIRPDMVLGHSVGEIGAMCVAGGVSLDDGLKLIAARGRLMQALPAGGTMTSVLADEGRVQAAIAGAEELVAIAAVNAPGQIVISGAGASVAEVTARLTADGIKTRALTVSHAFHSPLMRPMLAEYERVVRRIRFEVPRIPLVSCVNGAAAGDEMTRSDYWLRQVMDPVRFAAGMRTLDEAKVTAYIEIGPHPVLLGMGRQCLGDERPRAWLPSLRKDADNWQTMLGSAAKLYVTGAPLDWRAFDAPYSRRRVPAPAFQFARKQFWLRDVPRVATAAGTGVDAPRVYELAWRKRPLDLAPAGMTHAFVILANSAERISPVTRQLEAAGATVTVANPRSRHESERLWASLRQPEGGAGLRIVDLTALDACHGDRDGVTTSARAAESRLVRATYLVQTLLDSPLADAALWFVTREALAIGDTSNRHLSLGDAGVWGFGRTVALEHPQAWGGLIDVGPNDTDLAALARELIHGGAEDQVALRDGERFVPRIAPRSVDQGKAPALSPDGTYLITGGLGSLGLHVAGWLVDRGARHLVLGSRRAGRTDAVAAAVRALEARGATVSIQSADVSNGDDVRALLERISAGGAPLRGIVHAAGVDAPKPLRSLRDADIHAVFAGKATGAWLLHEATRTSGLELFVCFSSASSILGSDGRAHYAAANAFLDALAFERCRAGLPATVINWGPWAGGGMVDAAQLQQFERVGNRGLAPGAALRALDAILASGASQASVMDVDWATFAPVYESRRPRGILAEIAPRAPTSEAGGGGLSGAPWVRQLTAVPAEQRGAEIERLLRTEVADTLGFDDAAGVPDDRSFYDLGMDSLMMADLISRLRKQLGVSFNAQVFDHPYVKPLAASLLDQVAIDALGRGPVVPVVATPAQRGVHGYAADVEPEVFAFQTEAWPRRSAALIPDRWRWLFVESARRLEVQPRIWLHRDAGRLVGHMGSIPVRLKIGDEERQTGWLVDSMVLPAYRDRAIGSRLLVEAHRDQPFSLSLGQTAEVREILYRLGWKQVAPLQVAQFVVRGANVLRGKLPSAAAWAAGLGLDASVVLRRLAAERPRLDVRLVERFDERHDRLWQTAARYLTTAVVRDASYLNWKYVDQPGQRFLRLEFADGAEPTAVAVWMLKEPDEAYRYRRAFLVDLVAPFGDAFLLRRVIRAASEAAAEGGADALNCMHIGGWLTDALRQCGFRLRDPERFLLVDPGTLSGAALDAALSPDAWFVTQGDSDIDRPW